MPLVRPIRASHGTETVRRSTLIEVELSNGAVGWGECVALSEPTYSEEWAAGAFLLLATQLVPRLLAGARPVALGNPMAWFGVRTALADARLRAASRNLADELGGRPGASLARTQVLGRHDTVDELLAAVDPSATMVKIKVGPGWDAVPLAALRDAFPALSLAADANGSYASGMALPWTEGLVYVEEPFPLGFRPSADHIACPIAYDESVRPLEWYSLDPSYGTIINVKPARFGHFHLCHTAPRGSFVGGMYELGIGRAAALAVASQAQFATPTDLGPSSQYVAEDVTDPIVTDATGRIVVPSGPGIGVDVHRDRVRAALMDQPVELRP